MNRTTPDTLSDEELHALVDGQVPATERAALQARLAQDPAAQATVARWTQQREALRGLHRQVLDEPTPSTLLAAAQRTVAAQQTVDQWWRWGGMAAGLVMAFGVGWLAHGQWPVQQPSAALANAPAAQNFVRQASLAHAVYSPEVRHPVEVTAAEQEHLVQWLSKRVGKPLKVPNLGSEGFELVGGRLLPGEASARAQFMFQNPAGTRVTLYLGAVSPTPQGPNTQETAFRFISDGPAPSFYWVDQGFGYALSGPLPREALMKLAQAVYQQL
jgi:anti-sigma factor RsiW